MLIDTHAHLEMMEDIPGVIEKAKSFGIKNIVAVSSDINSSIRTLELSKTFPAVYGAVGIHPHEASGFNQEVLSEIEDFANNKKVVAIGETGLDYHYMHSNRDEQITSFKGHIGLAIKLNLPVVIHVRDAHQDVINVLSSYDQSKLKGVIHCYSSGIEDAEKYLDMDLYISFSGIVTFKNAGQVREAAKNIPLQRLLIETDSPYLAPVPLRGKKNEPANVRYVAAKIAELRNISFEYLEEVTTKNAQTLLMLV